MILSTHHDDPPGHCWKQVCVVLELIRTQGLTHKLIWNTWMDRNTSLLQGIVREDCVHFLKRCKPFLLRGKLKGSLSIEMLSSTVSCFVVDSLLCSVQVFGVSSVFSLLVFSFCCQVYEGVEGACFVLFIKAWSTSCEGSMNKAQTLLLIPAWSRDTLTNTATVPRKRNKCLLQSKI